VQICAIAAQASRRRRSLRAASFSRRLRRRPPMPLSIAAFAVGLSQIGSRQATVYYLLPFTPECYAAMFFDALSVFMPQRKPLLFSFFVFAQQRVVKGGGRQV